MLMDYKDMTGLVLSGGGGKGAYQVGVIKALQENNLLTDIGAISGVSIGAVNSILFAMGGYETMKKAWDEINMETVFDISADHISQGNPYFSRSEMTKLMDKYVDYFKLSNMDTDLYCGVCRIENERYWAEYMCVNEKSEEEMRKILQASTSLPVIYEPVQIGDYLYRDGGIMDNEPIKPLYDLGVRKFIVIGLDANKVFDAHYRYKDADFKVIYPSHDLGDLFSGTLNFSDFAKDFRYSLGYKDGLRAVKTKFLKDESYIAMERKLAENDYLAVMNEVRTLHTMKEVEASTNRNIDKFNDIAKKYGAFFDDEN